MAHVEMIATMVHQLMENATIDELKKAGLGGNYADHRKALFYTDATGNPCPIKQRYFGKNTSDFNFSSIRCSIRNNLMQFHFIISPTKIKS